MTALPRSLSFTEPLRTPRLVLRPVVAGDAEALLDYRSRPELCRYVPFAPMDAAEIDRRIAGPWAMREIAAEGDGLLVGVQRADTGELIGDVSIWAKSAEHRSGEIGWMVHPTHGGQGFATEAAHGALHLMFDRLELHRVVARVDARNEPSLAVCDRLGMRREALLVENEWFKGEWGDEIDCALLEREWLAQHAGGSGSCRWPLIDG